MIDAESGWVSYNHLTYYRLVKCMYPPITTLEKGYYVVNSSPVDTWNKNVR